MNLMEEAFKAIGKPIPAVDDMCIYRSGLVDSFELMQLIMEIELLGGPRIDLALIMAEEVTLRRLRAITGAG
jgi:hypothetical protein